MKRWSDKSFPVLDLQMTGLLITQSIQMTIHIYTDCLTFKGIVYAGQGARAERQQKTHEKLAYQCGTLLVL